MSPRPAIAFILLAASAFLLSLHLAPPINWDDGWFCLVAHAWKAFWIAGVEGFSIGHASAFTHFFAETQGRLFMHTTAKPVLVFGQTLMLIVSGGAKAWLSLPAACAYAGTVIVSWKMARAWAARKEAAGAEYFGIAAAAVVATSPFFLFYAASWLGQPMATFFLTTALGVHSGLLAPKRRGLALGLLYAFAILSHYSLFPIVVPLAAMELWRARRDARGLATFIAAFLGPFALLSAWSLVLAAVVDASIRPDLIWSYPREFLEQVRTNSGRTAWSWHYYLTRLAIFDGWPAVLLIAAGFFSFRKGGDPILRRGMILVTASFFFYTVLPTQAARTMLAIIPVAYLAGIGGLRDAGARRWIPVVVAVIILVRLPFAIDLARFQNPWRALVAAVPVEARAASQLRWPVWSCIAERRFSTPLDGLPYDIFIDDGGAWDRMEEARAELRGADIILRVPVRAFSARNLWDDEDLGERVPDDAMFTVYRK